MTKRPSKHLARTGKVRIIAGKHRGRKLAFPLLDGLRPTPDRVKETLFNWLTNAIEGSHCLDLYSGSGALGLEALSRSAASVTFVDSSAEVAKHLRRTLGLLHEQADILQTDALAWLATEPDTRMYDVVFLDPPFGQNLVLPSCNLLAQKKRLKTGAWIYIEAEVALARLSLPANWHIKKQKQTGEILYTLCRQE